MKMAYCTLLSSEDYLDAVLVLNRSLQYVKSQYPLLVMVVDNIFSEQVEQRLNQEQVLYITIPSLSYSHDTQILHPQNSVLNTASKLRIFYLQEWDKIVYLDADVIVLRNIDDLFYFPDGAMLKDPDSAWGFSGLFVIEPQKHAEREFYLSLIEHTVCFDGDLLGKCWAFVVNANKDYQIPCRYMQNYNPKQYDYSETNIIHYSNQPKPWLVDEDINNYPNDNPAAALYRSYLSEIDFSKKF